VSEARLNPWGELIRLLLALALAGAAVTLIAGIAAMAGAHEPSRIGRKGLVPLVVIAWIVMARVPRNGLPQVLGLAGGRTPMRSIAVGLLCGALSLVILNVVLILMGARLVEPELGPAMLLLKTILYLLQAVGLALLEETLFRGLVQGRLRAASGHVVAITLGSVIFAASHFLRPPKSRPPEAWWDTMPACFAGLGEMLTLRWREFVGLLLVGLVLAIVRAGRRTIFLAMGVHAGWVWVRFTSNKALEEVDERVNQDLLLLGSKRLYDGALGWCALLLTLGFVCWLTVRSRNRGTSS
jgi:membrane protease YdiL (CAAX protease family)